MSRWSDDHHGLNLSPSDYDYVTHSVVMSGPSVLSPSERGPDEPPLRSPGYVEDDSLPRPPSRLGKSIRKIVRRMSYRIRGKASKDENTGPEPLFTGDALFAPDTDQQLTFQRPVAADTGADRQEAARFNWDEHIQYCTTCETSYLIGKAGVKYACLHPHHLSTLNGQRSLAVVAETTLIYNNDGQLRLKTIYDFGPRSKYNREVLVGLFDNEAEALAYSVRDCLDYVVEEVLPERQDQVVRDFTVTDNVFLQEVPWRCRLLIFTGLRGAPSVLKDNAGPEMRELAAAIKRVARLGIDLKWFNLESVDFPEMGIAV